MRNSALLFGLLFVSGPIAALIGLLWVPRLPKATQLEAAPVIVTDGPLDADIARVPAIDPVA